MRFDELKQKKQNTNKELIHRLGALANTRRFQTMVDKACADIEVFLSLAKRPAISCGGGKDGTASAILALKINPDIPIYCANPPNPLPTRADHLVKLKASLGRKWVDVDYWWNVQAVLNGEIPYPHGLKMKRLQEAMEIDNIDGVIMGVRMAESKGRRINGILRGTIYKVADGSFRCLPVLTWSAEETLALSILFNIPINPVYYQNTMSPNLEYLRDGTWWCHGYSDNMGFGEWLKHYHTELYDDYTKAVRVMDDRKSAVCMF